MVEIEQTAPLDTEMPQSQRRKGGKGVWFFVEYKEGRVDESCLKLAGEARHLSDKFGEEATAIIVGTSVRDLAGQFEPYGIDRAVVIEDERLDNYSGDTYVDVLSQLVESDIPSIFIFSASTVGRDLAPRLAVKLKTAFAACYSEIDIDKEANITVRRAIHGGNAQATVAPLRTPLIGTIDTHLLGDQKPKVKRDTQVIEARARLDPKTSVSKVIDYLRADPCAVCVSEAEIVIGVGKGLNCAENLVAVEELARVMGASIGGSRRATDERWVVDERRIGLTGKTISPDLYLICGISGAFHHTLSIKGARLKVVVNKDINAPISKMADLMVVGDMQEIIPELTKQLSEILRPAA